MNYFLLDIWQQLIGQVCECKHTKRHHIRLGKDFAERSDVQCLNLVFKGGGFGEHGTLSCCQCLSFYKQKRFTHLYWKLKSIFVKPKPISSDPKDYQCVCGHNAEEHSIGDSYSLFPLYPPCQRCKCKEYDYVNNPRVNSSELQNYTGVNHE